VAGVRIGGSDELNDLSQRLIRAAGSDVFVKAAGEAMEAEVPSLVDAARKGTERLPQRGGFARLVAKTRFGVKVQARGGGITIRIIAHPNAVVDPGAIDRGRARHLTYGRKPWHVQLVPKGWFSEPIRERAPQIRARVADSIREALRKV
jgi:hypothetical protein